MEHSEYILNYKWLSCRHLDASDFSAVQEFTSVRKGNDGGFLADYIKRTAFIEEKEHLARTYLIIDNVTDEIVAYFSLRNGFAAANERGVFIRKKFDSMSGIEISNFAINGRYKDNHPSVGSVGSLIFSKFIIPVAEKARNYSGANIIYIFSLNRKSLIKHYNSWGFSRLSLLQERAMHIRIRPRYDAGCIFMYQKI